MGVNSLPKTVTRQRRDCDLNPGPSAPESSTLTTRLPSRAVMKPQSHFSSADVRCCGVETRRLVMWRWVGGCGVVVRVVERGVGGRRRRAVCAE